MNLGASSEQLEMVQVAPGNDDSLALKVCVNSFSLSLLVTVRALASKPLLLATALFPDFTSAFYSYSVDQKVHRSTQIYTVVGYTHVPTCTTWIYLHVLQ